MESGHCWQCNHPAENSLFCHYCNSLQRPTADYYRFFDLPRKLSIDTGDLQRRFYELSRVLHPDRYTRHAAKEQQYSLEATAILNDGYRVLREPISRAEYVLTEEGFDIGEQRSKDVPPELLEEVFELNMALEELRQGDDSVRGQLDEARSKFLGMRDRADEEMQALFLEWDNTQDRALLERLRALLNRRRYIRNLVNEVEKELATRR